jgi:hypothetical protein
MYRVIIFSNCVDHGSVIAIGKVSVPNSLRQSFEFFSVKLTSPFKTHCCKQMSRFNNVVVKFLKRLHNLFLFQAIGNFMPVYMRHVA